MRTSHFSLTSLTAAAVLLLLPGFAEAQRELHVASVESLEPIGRCGGGDPAAGGPMWSTLMEVVTLDRDVAKDSLRVLQESATVVAAERPDDVQAQFLLAAILGARAEVEGGRSKIRVADDLLAQLEVVLGLQPDHPGALHLLGRLNASVMRLDGVTRFIATHIMGGDRLGSASWQAAERLFQRAIAYEPCLGDHRLQLARAYADQGKRQEARAELRRLFGLGPHASRDTRVWTEAMKLAEELGETD